MSHARTRTTKQLVGDDLTPVAAYAALRARSGGEPSFLLESVPIGGERWGRYSLLGFRPRRRITMDLLASADRVQLRVEPLRGGGEVVEASGPSRDALALLRAHAFREPSSETSSVGAQRSGAARVSETPRVLDGAVGWVAYDLVHALEPIPGWTRDGRIVELFEGATLVVFDALLQTITIHGEDPEDVEEAVAALDARVVLRRLPLPDRRDVPADIESNMTDVEYGVIVERAKEYIRAGDVFQVVLSRTFRCPRDGADPFDAYRALRVLNPSPYLYFLDLGDRAGTAGANVPSAIAGASPETLVRLENGVLTVRPLAGTRPRDVDPERDAALERELLGDPKERAEHVMLVDLGRNDIGRVAKIGSVSVPVQMAVERYSHVMHIVSEVHGELGEGRDAWDVLGATFPAGTLSGAPKVRAMQIIHELEGRERGIYGGAIGYVSPRGTMDLAIAIRTVVAYADRFEVGAGAGIVEASDPEAEAQETRHKAGASLAAVATARSMASRDRPA